MPGKKPARKRPGTTRKRDPEVIFEEERTILAREQTMLSKERTVLSFMRTGLAFIGAGIIIINVFLENYQSQIIGWALVLIGFVEILESYKRLRKYQRVMDRLKKKIGRDRV